MRHFPPFWYERLVPPPWIWTERLQQPAEEEASYPPAIRHRFAQAYSRLAQVEASLWAGRPLPVIEAGEQQGYLTSIYYGQACTLTFSLHDDPWSPRSQQVIHCGSLGQLERVLATLHLPPTPASQPALFAEAVPAHLESSQIEQTSSANHMPLTRDLWYPEQLIIAPRRCW